MDTKVIVGAIIALLTSIITVYVTSLIKSRRDKEKEDRERIAKQQVAFTAARIENTVIAGSIAQQNAVGVLAVTVPELNDRIKRFIPEGCGLSIGRSTDNDLVLPDPEGYLSGTHALITSDSESVWIIDIATNGTYLNNEENPIGNGNRRLLKTGDVIKVGNYDIQYTGLGGKS